ncbi:hypothetical protein HPB51_021024 [Rhipicephalus microplus]|uniref:Uncharacterized protein n=1 Tax=Rhipicephalus microplus TaxID=6941 RepID=A0A9J6DCZ4_RHIMP|nr:hypothetical protein HPB51_021024 [Rhipicephalus microplus]
MCRRPCVHVRGGALTRGQVSRIDLRSAPSGRGATMSGAFARLEWSLSRALLSPTAVPVAQLASHSHLRSTLETTRRSAAATALSKEVILPDYDTENEVSGLHELSPRSLIAPPRYAVSAVSSTHLPYIWMCGFSWWRRSNNWPAAFRPVSWIPHRTVVSPGGSCGRIAARAGGMSRDG